jgi:ribosomal protein L11 methylase PrmA
VLVPGAGQYRAVRETGFLALAARSGRLIEGREIDPQSLGDEEPGAVHVIEHPPLSFISYPYEWSFNALQAAALLTLDLHLDAFEHGLTMTDASAYNVQFDGPDPIFIDYLSVCPYEAGQVWLGYRQFCEQFLNPLLLTAKTGVAFQTFYRGNPDGLPSAELSALLPWRTKLDPRIALHVILQGRMQGAVTAGRSARAKSIRLSESAFAGNLRAMRAWVATLAPPASQVTPWQRYERTAHYTPDEHAAKSRFVADVVRCAGPQTVWDLGCNSGEYAEVALRSGARRVIGFEPDAGALNAAFDRARAKGLSFLPLSLDLTNPSPSLGWRQQERPGLMERRNADLVLCLALLHHLVLARSLPLSQVLDWLISLAPKGVVEFVPRDDPMALQLIAFKPRVPPDYTRESFLAMLGSRAQVVREEVVTQSGRLLVAYTRA